MTHGLWRSHRDSYVNREGLKVGIARGGSGGLKTDQMTRKAGGHAGGGPRWVHAEAVAAPDQDPLADTCACVRRSSMAGAHASRACGAVSATSLVRCVLCKVNEGPWDLKNGSAAHVTPIAL